MNSRVPSVQDWHLHNGSSPDSRGQMHKYNFFVRKNKKKLVHMFCQYSLLFKYLTELAMQVKSKSKFPAQLDYNPTDEKYKGIRDSLETPKDFEDAAVMYTRMVSSMSDRYKKDRFNYSSFTATPSAHRSFQNVVFKNPMMGLEKLTGKSDELKNITNRITSALSQLCDVIIEGKSSKFKSYEIQYEDGKWSALRKVNGRYDFGRAMQGGYLDPSLYRAREIDIDEKLLKKVLNTLLPLYCKAVARLMLAKKMSGFYRLLKGVRIEGKIDKLSEKEILSYFTHMTGYLPIANCLGFLIHCPLYFPKGNYEEDKKKVRRSKSKDPLLKNIYEAYYALRDQHLGIASDRIKSFNKASRGAIPSSQKIEKEKEKVEKKSTVKEHKDFPDACFFSTRKA